MTEFEPLTVQAVQFMLTCLDRCESFAIMFHHTIVESENEPLNELCQRLPSLFSKSTSLETQAEALGYLIAYIMNPLNSRKVTHQLSAGLVEALRSQDGYGAGSGVRLVLSTLLRTDIASMSTERTLKTKFIRPVISMLDVGTTRDVLNEVVSKIFSSVKSQRKRKFDDREVVANLEAQQDFLRHLLDSGCSMVPLVVVLQELGKHMPNAGYYVQFIHPFTGFSERVHRLLNLLRIPCQEEYYPIVGYTLVYPKHSANDSHRSPQSPLWGIDKKSLRFISPEMLSFATPGPEPTKLIQFLIEQAHSRHTYQAVLGLKKNDYEACGGLEDQLVNAITLRLTGTKDAALFGHWLRISSDLYTMITVKWASFRSIMEKISVALDDLPGEGLMVGRNFLMWALYQVLAASKFVTSADLMVCRHLFTKLYTELEVIPVPDFANFHDVVKLGPAYLWFYILRRAKVENFPVPWNTPFCLNRLVDYVVGAIDRSIAQPGFPGIQLKPEHAAVVNSFFVLPVVNRDVIAASKMDYVNRMANSLIDYMIENCGSSYAVPSVKTVVAPGGCAVYNVTKPLSMDFLDAVSIHIRVILGESLKSLFNQIITSFRDGPGTVFLSPALWETVARMILYEETSVHVLQLLVERLPDLGKVSSDPGTASLPDNVKAYLLSSNFEILAFRTPFVPVTWKGNVLVCAVLYYCQFYTTVPSAYTQALTNIYQTVIRTVQSFNVEDFSHPSSHLSHARLYQADSEEITRLLLLTLFRLSSIVGMDHTIVPFMNAHLAAVQNVSPHTWSQHILATLPDTVQMYYANVSQPVRPDRKPINRAIEDTVQKLRVASTDMEMARVFEALKSQIVVIYCVIWRQLVNQLESNDATVVPFKGPKFTAKMLDFMNLKTQMTALRHLMDFIIADIANQVTNPVRIGRFCDCLSLMIWKYHILPFDRVLLVLLLRHFDLTGDQVNFPILAVYMLCKSPDFLARLNETINLLPPRYWEAENYFEKLVAYHQSFPEHLYFNGNFDLNSRDAVVSHPRYPMYFSNVILRTVPLFDIIVHRFIELPGQMAPKQLESVLDLCGKIFKFHDRPVTFLWQTFHFYDNLLKDSLTIRRKLVQTVIGHKAEQYPPHFYLSPLFTVHLAGAQPETPALPVEYFQTLLERLYTCMYSHETATVYGQFDWRFHEFPNATTHCLYSSCVELMSIPGGAGVVVEGLVGSVRGRIEFFAGRECDGDSVVVVERWINCVALLLSAMPPRYFGVLLRMLDNVILAPEIHSPEADIMSLLDLSHALTNNTATAIAFAHQLVQVTLLHNNIDLTLRLLSHIHTTTVSTISTLTQLIFLLKLVTPLLGKIATDTDRLKVFLGDMFQLVTKVAATTRPPLDEYVSLVNEALFFILDTYPVDLTRDFVMQWIGGLPEAYQVRLRFLSQAKGVRL